MREAAVQMPGVPLLAGGKSFGGRMTSQAQAAQPMLFLQGTRDALADLALMRQTVAGLGGRATLHEIDGADHAFHVLVRSGRTDAQVIDELADAIDAWTSSVQQQSSAG